MGFFSAISKVVFREYDRRIKRASLITEYGAGHHSHAHDDHTSDEHGHDEGDAEIVNVPRGTPVQQAKH